MEGLRRYDAILLVSFGGPEAPGEVMPFLHRVTRGRNVPQERLAAVAEHYFARGGSSPINGETRALREALVADLDRRGLDIPVLWGNRNAAPFVADALGRAVALGARRIAVLRTSAYPSYSSCRQYREDLAAAVASLPQGGRPALEVLPPFADSEPFVTANADLLARELRLLTDTDGVPAGRRRVLFVAHSIPESMSRSSGPPGAGGLYVSAYRRAARRIAALAAADDDVPRRWELTYCSRSGSPHVPWLEPDVNDVIRALPDDVQGIVIAPIGFVADHMEVVHDLDVEAEATAAERGVTLRRASTVRTHPAFVRGLLDLLARRAEGARTPLEDEASAAGSRLCGAGCCADPRPTRTT